MDTKRATGAGEASRRARFGRLPERVSMEEMVEMKPATPSDPMRNAYDPEASWQFMSCWAVDLGL